MDAIPERRSNSFSAGSAEAYSSSVVARGTNTFRARVLLHQRSVGMHEMTLSVQLTECSRCTEDRSHCIRPTDFSWKRPGCHAEI